MFILFGQTKFSSMTTLRRSPFWILDVGSWPKNSVISTFWFWQTWAVHRKHRIAGPQFGNHWKSHTMVNEPQKHCKKHWSCWFGKKSNIKLRKWQKHDIRWKLKIPWTKVNANQKPWKTIASHHLEKTTKIWPSLKSWSWSAGVPLRLLRGPTARRPSKDTSSEKVTFVLWDNINL